MVETSLDYLKENKDAFTEYQLVEEIIKLIGKGYQKKQIYEALEMGHSKFYVLLSKYKNNELKDEETTIKLSDREVKAKIKEMLLKNYTRNAICLELHIGRRRLYKLIDSMKEDEDLKDYFDKQNLKDVCKDTHNNNEVNDKNNEILSVTRLLENESNREKKLEEQVLEYYNKVISVWTVCDELNITVEELNKLVIKIEKKNRLNGVKVDLNVKEESDDFTLGEKISYANATYGYNSWHFISREELKSLIKYDKI